MTTILNFLFLSWVFWPIAVLALLIPALALRSIFDCNDTDFLGFPLLAMGVLLGAVWWRWTVLFPSTWVGWAWLAGLYVVAGFVVSLIKYLKMLSWFRREATALYQVMTIKERQGFKEHFAKSYHAKGTWQSHAIVTDDAITFDWTTAPLANWLTYWPYFLLSGVFNFIIDLGQNLVNLFKGLYARLAARFSVKL